METETLEERILRVMFETWNLYTQCHGAIPGYPTIVRAVAADLEPGWSC